MEQAAFRETLEKALDVMEADERITAGMVIGASLTSEKVMCDMSANSNPELSLILAVYLIESIALQFNRPPSLICDLIRSHFKGGFDTTTHIVH